MNPLRTLSAWILAALLLVIPAISPAQTICHKRGSFVKSGNAWTEYLDGKKHSSYTQTSQDEDFYYLKNKQCQVAVPKYTAGKFYLKKGNGWKEIYSDCTNVIQPGAQAGNSSTDLHLYAPTAHEDQCGVCHGNGKCWCCGGSGWSPNHAPGIQAKCGACGGDGKCHNCGGLGTRINYY